MSKGKWMTERPVRMLPYYLYYYWDGVDDVSNEGTTCSCGHTLCSSGLHQLEIVANKSSRQAQVVQSSVHEPSHRLGLLEEVFMALVIIYSPVLMPGQIKYPTMAPTPDMVQIFRDVAMDLSKDFQNVIYYTSLYFFLVKNDLEISIPLLLASDIILTIRKLPLGTKTSLGGNWLYLI
jgi:hypothetical protein